MNEASAPAYKFAPFILSTEGQRMLANEGRLGEVYADNPGHPPQQSSAGEAAIRGRRLMPPPQYAGDENTRRFPVRSRLRGSPSGGLVGTRRLLTA